MNRIKWQNRYSETDTPDDKGRWAIDGYVSIDIDKGLPQYEWFKKFGDTIDIRIVTIKQQTVDSINGHSLSDYKYYFEFPTFEDSANGGFSKERLFYAPTIDELKALCEVKLNDLITVLNNIK